MPALLMAALVIAACGGPDGIYESFPTPIGGYPTATAEQKLDYVAETAARVKYSFGREDTSARMDAALRREAGEGHTVSCDDLDGMKDDLAAALEIVEELAEEYPGDEAVDDHNRMLQPVVQEVDHRLAQECDAPPGYEEEG